MTRTDVENPPLGSDDASGTHTPKLDEIDLDQLGRQRPECFPNLVYEVLFCSSLLVSMFMAVSQHSTRDTK